MQEGKGVQGCRGRGSKSGGPIVDRGGVWVGLGGSASRQSPLASRLDPIQARVENGLDRAPYEGLVSMENKVEKAPFSEPEP